jgi:hypothetical protein
MASRLPVFRRRNRLGPGDLDAELEDDHVDGHQPAVDEPPTRMRGREPLQAYVVAAVLAVVGVLNLLVTTGKGAPAHPTLWLSYAGIVIAVLLAGSVQLRNRLISPFTAIIGAFFVTTAKAPAVLSIPHLIALFAALGFALTVSLRQRKDQKAAAPAGARGRGRRRGQAAPDPGEAKRPAANRRYTPPKAKETGKTPNRRRR